MNTSRLIRRAGPLGLYALARQLTRYHPRILMYHRFSETPRAGFVSAAAFEQQVAHIARHYRPVTLGTLIHQLREGSDIQPHTVVITVDDGYRDFYDVALPILNKHRVPATLFVTTGFVDGALWLWPDQVQWALDNATRKWETLEVAGVSVIAGPDAWQRIIDILLGIPDGQKHAAIQELATALGAQLPGQAPDVYASVTWEQLRTMRDAGIELGGHTHTHPTLPKVAPDGLAGEINYCLDRLDAELGTTQRPFCYPNGQPDDFSQTVRDAVENAGFIGAVVAYADADTHTDLYALRRHSSSNGSFQFHKAISGLEWLGRRARQRGSVA